MSWNLHQHLGLNTGGNHAYGIYTGSTTQIYNNMVYDLRNIGGSNAPQVRAIAIVGGASNSIYYNTVYLDAVGTNANYSTAALYVSGGTTNRFINNIFMNASTPGANGQTVAFWKTVAGFANIHTDTDRNIYYAGTPGPANLICYNATTPYQTLTEYKTAVASFDQGSLTEAVPFVSSTSPYNVHIDPLTPTRVEGNALPITGIDFDIDGDTRNASTPDIGADEGDFLILEEVPDPAILVSPVDDDYAVSLLPTLVWMPSSSGGAPTGYKLFLGTDYPPSNVLDELDLGIDLSYTVTTSLNYLTTYYWMIVPYNENGDAQNCPVWSFETHRLPLSGTYTIGSTGFFPDFTHAIRHLNAAGVGTGGVTFNVTAGEVFAENPPAITATGTADNPILFQSDDRLRTNPLLTPEGGTDTFGIKIEGGDYITIDGIDIANATGSTTLMHGYWILALTGNGATNNTIKNCSITLDRSSGVTYGIRSQSGSGRLNHNNLYQNNTITNSRNGIYLDEHSSVLNTTVQGNTISDVANYGIYLNSGTSSVISGNNISMASGNTMAFYGIYIYSQNTGSQIFQNTITGSTTTASFYGINLYSGTHHVYQNTVSNLTSSGRFWGYTNYSGSVSLHDNLITDLSTTNTSSSYGIDLSSTSQAFDNTVKNLVSGGTLYGFYGGGNAVYRNHIHNLQSNSSGSGIVYGLVLAAGSNVNVYNNLIYDLRNPNGTSAPQVRGMGITGGSINVHYNSVLLDATGNNTNFSTAALYFSNSGGTNDFKNNIFDNRSIPGASGMTVALWKTVEGFANMSAGSNNNIWHAGTPSASNLICYNATTACQTLEDYKTLNAAKDQNSFTEMVPFVSVVAPYDLHIDPLEETVVEGNALVIASITTDFDGDTRSATHPDIGADEGDFTPITGAPVAPSNLTPVNGATNVALNAQLTWSPGGGGGLPTSYNVYFGTASPPPLVASVTTSYYAPVLAPETTYNWKIEAVNDYGTATGPTWSFTTRDDYTIVELPYTKSFENGNTNGSTTIYRWTQALGSGSNYWTANTATSYNRTPRTGSFNVTLAAIGNAWLFRPIYLDENMMYELELWARQYRDSGSYALLEVKFGTAPEIASMTNTIISTTEFINGAYQRASGIFAPDASGLYYLGIHGVCTIATNFLSLDDIGIDYYYTSPGFAIDPTAWDFGPITVDTTSPVKDFQITNSGDAELVIMAQDVSITGVDEDDFILSEVEDDIILQPAQTATVSVTFAPLTTGIKNAFLQIIDNTAGRATQLIPLTGRGMGPLDPPFVMDFEDNWDDWTVVNGSQTNKWEVGSSTRYRNQKSAYISNNAGLSNAYTTTSASIVHFYHDLRFPEDVSDLSLKFNWKGMGESGFDYLSLHLVDNSFTPEAGTPVGSGQIGLLYSDAADWQYASLPIDPANAGQIKRLIFSWRNDAGGGMQPPAAIDNIRIMTGDLVLAAPQNLSGTGAGSNITLSWDLVPDANEYIIEDSDMFDGVFTPVARSGNPIWTTPGSYLRRFFRVRATD